MPDSLSSSYFFVFLRHGESVGNAEDRFQGQYDFPLTSKGVEQAEALTRRWKSDGLTFDLNVSSPLLRARQTAEIVSKALAVPLEFDPDWMEINNGLLAGLTEDQAAQTSPRPDFMTPYTRFGKVGESRWEVYLRAGRAIQRILDRPPGRYLVTSHGGILNLLMYAVLGVPVQTDFSGPRFIFQNAGFAVFLYEPAHHNWRMLAFDNSRLEDNKWIWGA
jgi:2,3-bisphosphoglycerate-dependent phosphoglycerate mutase